ncbi:hypothetical protein FVEN_g8274 [Fusarium venenatum]|uniref:Kinetochore protein fta4 n=1 Tax=Fusarium venenatum TaxID=56646 RepID=A0A2L2TLV7_9HYPO|nr:uncharacterized protein FVRRES_03063 [Fusarium venenatum]KAG8353778.1 hypothetical protein FVEN_g8274 [Fusarium venenatum]KAH7003879.1 kinetochore Sim4 complex subunit Fta4 [Fusarium venenatum]CEI66551.1 unnamed protein product [Fusarium venenatum]
MSARASAPTIPALKQSFLANQTTLLAQPLAPSRSWQATNDASDEPLTERVVQDVLFNLNHTIQQHCRRVYSPQASRNIAEQIDNVFTQEAERKVGGPADAKGGIGRELDLTDSEAIESLQVSWHIEKDVNDHPVEVKRYADAVARLTELSDQRKRLRTQVARLNHLKTIVEPLQTTDNGAGIQENLLTRNGPVEKELEKMRFLLARVGGRVHALPERTSNDVPKEISLSETGSQGRKRRVDQFLADEVFQ